MGHRQPKDPTDSPTRCPRSHLLGAEWLGKQEAEPGVSGCGRRAGSGREDDKGHGQTRALTGHGARTSLEESSRPSGRLVSRP